MKVFEVVPFWPAEVFVQRHISALAETSLHVQTIARVIDFSVRSSSILSDTNLMVEEMPRFDGLNVVKKAFQAVSLWNAPDLLLDKRGWQDKLWLRYFRSNKPDLIHFHWGTLASRLAWIPLELGIPFTFSVRGHDVQERMLDDEYTEQLSFVIKSSAGVHSVCESIWHEALELCEITESTAFHKTIYTTVPAPAIRKYQGSKSGCYVFVTIGRLHWRKNFVGLLIAFKRLLLEGLRARLVIIGDGDLKECLGYWVQFLNISDSVSFAGTLSYAEINAFLEKSDAYIQSSVAEGFSNSLAEAMALGVPVFATDVGGTREIIRDGENGFLLDVEQPEIWWQKLILIQNKEMMQAIGEQAWKDAQQLFSAASHAQQFMDFYSKSSGTLRA